MLKTFSLVKKQVQQISDTEGKMTFYLKDENGTERTVSGITHLDGVANTISISALRPREYPLIQCLYLTEVNEQINIDFTQYNDVFERKEEVKVSTAEDINNIVKEMQEKPLRLGALLKSTEVTVTESMS